MSGRRITRYLSVTAAGVATCLIAATAARGVEPEGHAWLNCGTGHISAVTFVEEPTAALAHGEIDACGLLSEYEYFALAQYSEFVVSGTPKLFGTEQHREYSASTLLREQETVAVCVIVAPDVRLDCVAITWNGSDPVAGEHLPVDSPAVQKAADIRLPDDNGPGCQGCDDPGPGGA